MIECILPAYLELLSTTSAFPPNGWASTYDWSDECCEDVVAKCHCYEDNFEWLQNIGFMMIFMVCEDKISLNRPAPVLEWQDDVEIWFGAVRLAHFSLREWLTFQGRVRRILEEDDSDGHARSPVPHAFFTNLKFCGTWPGGGATDGYRLKEQIDWILAFRQRISLKECRMLEDVSAALNNNSNPPIELRFRK